MHSPLLTIAIPTYNRANYLGQNLEQLKSELSKIQEVLVEIIVSDNCSQDNTKEIVDNFNKSGFLIQYFRNETNIGWGQNFLQCFNYANGKYVLLLGDDDLLFDGALKTIVVRLLTRNYGVVFLRPYGFNADFRKEYPGSFGNEKVYEDTNDFLLAISSIMRMISASIINKELIKDLDTRELIVGNFAHLHLILNAVLAEKKNLFINKFLVASKRNNSIGYNFSKLYVEEFLQLLDSYVPMGISPVTIRTIENRMLFTYYPFYLLKERIEGTGDRKVSLAYFSDRFKGRLLFEFWVAPILKWPKPFAVVWGAFTTLIGRTSNGELARGLAFLWKSIIGKARGVQI